MIRLIAAVDRRLGIGKHGGQPWYLPTDEQFFSSKTKENGGIALTAKKTYLTFQGPLPERKNYVLTHDETPLPGAELVHDLPGFLEGQSDVWIIGGGQLFKQCIDEGLADELYLTHIDADFGCHVFFPEYKDKFELVEQSDLHEENGFIFRFATYRKS